jgi:hypothetical protein
MGRSNLSSVYELTFRRQQALDFARKLKESGEQIQPSALADHLRRDGATLSDAELERIVKAVVADGGQGTAPPHGGAWQGTAAGHALLTEWSRSGLPTNETMGFGPAPFGDAFVRVGFLFRRSC